MATDVLKDIQKVQDAAKAEYGGKMSNQFVAEMRGSTLFQFNWGELLAAAPTALSLMGCCWLAASDPKADKISLADSMPSKGFVYLTNMHSPTLRSCLVDVCNNGGREAFTLAGRNMDALQIRSQRITAERITIVFERLSRCTQGQDQLEDFRDALADFADDAKQCAKLATETRVAFNKWGKMVGELHVCAEAQVGKTSRERETAKIDEAVAQIDQKFASEAAKETKEQVKQASKQLENAEKRLDTAISNVPTPWESCIQGAVSGFLQAVPNIVSQVLPTVLAASNPMMGVGMALNGAAKQGMQAAPVNGADAANRTGASQRQQQALTPDPSYAAAGLLRDLVTHFYQYLGGDSGEVDWTKFEEKKDPNALDTPAGISYFIGNLNGQKSKIDVSSTDANKLLLSAIDTLIKISNELRDFIKTQNNLSAAALNPEVLAAWKRDAKKAKEDTLQLAAAANASGSGTVVNPFANSKINVPKADMSAQTAAVNGALQQVQMSQTAVDTAQDNYDAAVAKQAKTAAAMAEVERRLKRLQDAGKTLDEIKAILRDSISVLVDLSIQVGKIEQFFTMLSTVIDEVLMPRADTFNKEMDKVGRRATRDGAIKVDDLAKQTIYTATLQIKAYFSLLQDISSMYSSIHRDYIRQGVDLCAELSKGAASNNPLPEVQERLAKYTADSAKAVQALVDAKQAEILKGLRERARKAAEGVQLLESSAKDKGIAIDSGTKQAIAAGGQTVKDEAKEMLKADHSATVNEIDANAY